MSIEYARASVLTLNWIVCPAFTLMSVPKPWIEGSPSPSMSHSDGGLPGLLFSQAITWTGAAHGSLAARADGAANRTREDATTVSTVQNAVRRRLALGA